MQVKSYLCLFLVCHQHDLRASMLSEHGTIVQGATNNSVSNRIYFTLVSSIDWLTKLFSPGTSDLMIVEQLSLFYHLSCFVCSRCGIQLSDGQNETAVRIKNGLVYCYICYHRISKTISPKTEDHRRRRCRAQSDGRSPPTQTSSASVGHLSSNSNYAGTFRDGHSLFSLE